MAMALWLKCWVSRGLIKNLRARSTDKWNNDVCGHQEFGRIISSSLGSICILVSGYGYL